MKTHLMFFHKHYPDQFGPIIQFLMRYYDVKISFFSEDLTRPPHPDIYQYLYGPDVRKEPEPPYFYASFFEEECRRAYGIYRAVQGAKPETPDLLIGHAGFGGHLVMVKMVFPQVPSIGYFEYFNNPFDPTVYALPQFPLPPEFVRRIPLRNATQMLELEYCTKGYSPTPYQRSTFPQAYLDKLDVLFDGVDTRFYCPSEVGTRSPLPRPWPADARIVTFATRGLEASRGFDVFMEMAHQICQRRSDVHFVIAGSLRTYYGPDAMFIQEDSFKAHVLKRHPFDLSRFHFLNWIPEAALVDLFRLSDCHFYWTKPLTLSWSVFQAMATGALMVTSDSPPLRDVIEDDVNGFRIAPYHVEGFVERVLDVLDRPQHYQRHREAARETILQNYSLAVCLPKLAEYYFSTLSTPPTPLASTPSSRIEAASDV